MGYTKMDRKKQNDPLYFAEPPKEYNYQRFIEVFTLLIAHAVFPIQQIAIRRAAKFQTLENQIRVFCGNPAAAEYLIKLIREHPNQFENIEGAIDRLKRGENPYHVMAWVKNGGVYQS